MKLPSLYAKQVAFVLVSTAAMSSLWLFYRYEMRGSKVYSFLGEHTNIATPLFPNSTVKIKPPVIHSLKDDGWELNTVLQLRASCDTPDYNSKLAPIQDFRKYPCVKGLPVFPEERQATEGTCVRTFCDTRNNNLSTKGCVTLKTMHGKTPICTYPAATDIHISGSLQRTGQWEPGLVQNLAAFMKSRPNTEFLDLGCNIGVYTLSLALLGVKITSIDPLTENLELLSRSLHLGKLTNNVTLIWNAVSNKHKLVKFTRGVRNVGGTHIADANLTSVKNTRSYIASTVTLDDLVPVFKGKHVAIKMDIEASEYNALLGANKFFEEVHIDVIQMEVLLSKKGADGNNIFKYLTSKGFYPYRDISKHSSLKTITLPRWPNDVYFMKP